MSKFSILVNRERPLPKGCIPQNLTEPAIPFQAPPGDAKRLLVREAAAAAEKLFARAREEGLCLCGISGYRPTRAKVNCTGPLLRKHLRDRRSASGMQ